MFRRLPGLVLALTVLLWAADVFARAGGGGRFSGGGGRSFGGGGGGGRSFGGGGGIIYALPLEVWIVLIVVGIIVAIIKHYAQQKGGWSSSGGGLPAWDTSGPAPAPSAPPTRKLREAIAALRPHDPAFSRYVLLDFVGLLYRRFLEGHAGGQYASIQAYIAADIYARLGQDGVDEVDEAVIGGTTLEALRLRGERVEADVLFEASLRERRGAKWTRRYVKERWTLDKRRDALSPEPDAVTRLGCPSCGAAMELDVQGRCRFCANVVNRGDFGWVVRRMRVLETKPLGHVESELDAGGDEVGVELPTRYDPRLAAELRALAARDPSFDRAAFIGRVEWVFREIQEAWSTLAWERARPLETDSLFQQHRFWIERFQRDGKRNVLEDVRIEAVQLARVEPDPWYETLTVRVFASMRDYTLDAQGKVVGGNKRVPKRFSEYWTFIRRAGRGSDQAVSRDPSLCPSCSAPMQVDQAGVCQYCHTKVTTGDFDWVLALIDQDEVYLG